MDRKKLRHKTTVCLLYLVSISLLFAACGFEFDKTFADSDSSASETDSRRGTTDVDGDMDTDSDSDSDTDTDSDGDSDTVSDTSDVIDSEIPERPDFGLVGFAAVSGTCTGGAGGTTVTVSTGNAFIEAVSQDGPAVVQVDDAITLDDMISVASDKSILGVGNAGRISGGGLRLNGVSNVIIRNLTFTGSSDDAINIENNADHIWIDHNDLSTASDGLIDIKKGGSYVTISWNLFHDHDKVCLVGASDKDTDVDEGRLKVTVHHNWFKATSRQHPRCRFGEIHVFNNYLDSVKEYGIASTTEARVLSEANYFLNVDTPFSISEGTSPPGYIQSERDFFKTSGNPVENGTAFVPAGYYDYEAIPALQVPTLVTNFAGVGILTASDL